MAVCGFGSVPLLLSADRLLRPPGALDEKLFLASCFKCGQCLQVCPPQVIRLAGIDQGFGIGTPYIVPREGACILCAGLPCVLACPTGALDHHISEGKEAKMGLAVVSSPETCLAVRGRNDIVFRLSQIDPADSSKRQAALREILEDFSQKLTESEVAEFQSAFGWNPKEKSAKDRWPSRETNPTIERLKEFAERTERHQTHCTVCLDKCPIREENTIVFKKRHVGNSADNAYMPVVQKTCVGCGVCEEKCPVRPASITITPRLAWEEYRAKPAISS